MAQTDDELPDLSEAEVEAVHTIELGLEWLQRARGTLIEFHHATGHAMDHLNAGAVDNRWTYDLLETFEAGLLADATAYERQVRSDLADGHRHVAERRQEREWKRRARE